MTLTVYTTHSSPEGGTYVSPGRAVPGPADLGRYGAGSTVVVEGEPAFDEVSRWAAPIGAAVLRGATVRRA